MAAQSTKQQAWVFGFMATVTLLSFFPYRERALLPLPARVEQAFLAQELPEQASAEIIERVISRPGSRSAGSFVSRPRGNREVGARRFIPRSLRDAASQGLPPVVGEPDPEAPASNALEGSPVNLAGGPGNSLPPSGLRPLPGSGGSGGNGGFFSSPQSLAELADGPQTEPTGSPTPTPAGPTIEPSAVVPEPATWLLFIAGLMTIAAAMRSAAARRLAIRKLLGA